MAKDVGGRCCSDSTALWSASQSVYPSAKLVSRACLILQVRIVFRIAEFARGITPDNEVLFHEEYAYALDCFPMMVTLLILAIIHPGRYLVGPDSEFPHVSRKEKRALKQEKKAARREEKEAKKRAKTESKAMTRNEEEFYQEV
jgi:hypothetical protein